MRWTLPISKFVALIVATFCSAPAFAQTVQGRLVDDATGAPVAEAQVRALDVRGRTARQVMTGADGVFVLALPLGGSYSLRVSRVGYQPLGSLEVSVATGDTMELEVRIAVGAVPLEPLTVTSRRGPPRDPGLERRGFYARRASYERMGARFLDRSYLSRRGAGRASDVFRQVPGVRVRPGPNRSTTLTMRGACEASLFVDGQQVNRTEVSRDVQNSRRSIRDGGTGARPGTPGEAYDLARNGSRVDPEARINIDEMVAASSIVAVEVYQASQVPSEFSGYQARPCGAIVIWTGDTA